jgi:hypothetical protein
MRSIVQAALRRALCPGDQDANDVRALAKRIETRVWEPVPPKVGVHEGFGERLANRWRQLWKVPETDVVDHTYWRDHAAAWVTAVVDDGEIEAMRLTTGCVEAPRNAIGLGARLRLSGIS